ncbi:Heat shock protein 70 family [Cynara cardunculus var. scolymus]|uniref:Heat shock protein 70 family n=1 Tax=Cynara cardunculus var. scolymus TaxID=59895 RepID=A0A103XIT7_CYNCS|nr:Heat shock protein 70 family [Cynara cardunculus var. scolymus]
MILMKMKGVAQTFPGSTVEKVVITVPAYFNDSQRQSTKDAAKIAGLEVLRMINEPTSAAFAYALDKRASTDGKSLCRRIIPDEAVAYGAGYLAANLSDLGDEVVRGLKLIVVTPLSLGVSCKGDVMVVLIPKNTPIPTKKEDTLYKAYDDQTAGLVMVYQGERLRSSENYLLGQLSLSGLPSAPTGRVEIKICYEIDDNRIPHVSAKELTTGRNKAIKTTDGGGLSKAEIAKMIKDAERYKQEDEAHIKKAMTHKALNDYVYRLRCQLKLIQDPVESNYGYGA